MGRAPSVTTVGLWRTILPRPPYQPNLDIYSIGIPGLHVDASWDCRKTTPARTPRNIGRGRRRLGEFSPYRLLMYSVAFFCVTSVVYRCDISKGPILVPRISYVLGMHIVQIGGAF